MWYHKPFLVLAPPNILFVYNKKSLAKINLQRIYIFIIRQFFPISCLNKNNFWFVDIHQSSIWRYGSTLSGTLSLLFSPSGTKALMRQFVADAPKAHESLSTEARRVPVQGTPIPLISVFIAIFRLGTVWNDLFPTKIANLLEIDNIGKPWWFDNSRRGMTLLRRETPAFAQQKWPRWHSLSLRSLWIGSATSGICA